MMEATYDDSRLRQMFGDLAPKNRVKIFRSAFRKGASRLRRMVISNLRKKVNSSRELEKGVRTVIWKRAAGFRVTIGSKTQRSKKRLAAGKKERELPVLMWLEGGTDMRHSQHCTRAWLTSKKQTGRLRALRNRGMITPRHFMEDTREQGLPIVQENLKADLAQAVIKIARKYGSK